MGPIVRGDKVNYTYKPTLTRVLPVLITHNKQTFLIGDVNAKYYHYLMTVPHAPLGIFSWLYMNSKWTCWLNRALWLWQRSWNCHIGLAVRARISIPYPSTS